MKTLLTKEEPGFLLQRFNPSGPGGRQGRWQRAALCRCSACVPHKGAYEGTVVNVDMN